MGAFISQGATTLAAGSYSLLTQKSSLTPLLAAALAISSIAWSGGVAQVTTAAAVPGLSVSDVFITTLAGQTPGGYAGTYLATVTGANTFTFPLAVNPGAETVPGTYTPPGQGELQAMNNTFFGQGQGQAVYVLELGAGDGSTGPALLGTWITANPGFFYSYLVPRNWDSQASYLALVAGFENLSSMTYFFTTTSAANYTNYTAQMKSVLWLVEAPSTQAGGLRPLTEFSMAAPYQVTLNYAPSATNKQTQLNNAFLFGVTPYPTVGNNALLTAIGAANGSVIGTGAEGGISTATMTGGTTADGNDFSYWYSVDWIQLHSAQALAAAVIDGANNPTNPLDYDQAGIDTLQDVIVGQFTSAVSFGLANGSVTQAGLDGPAFVAQLDAGTYAGQDVVNAVPFADYTEENPDAYKEGTYGGFTGVYIPMRGFRQIIFNIQVTDLISSQ
jgi:hypothetical protein